LTITFPERTCVGTRVRKPKSELIKIVAKKVNGGFEISVDIDQNKSGRGVYILHDLNVFQEAIKRGKIGWGLRIGRRLTKEEVDKLSEEFERVINKVIDIKHN
jgi:predicted RNA-binding protein YlxR (DUF448 family)